MDDTQFPISKDSRYARVITIARRARQLIQEAEKKGVNPWEVSLAKSGIHKPVKLAEEEVIQGLVGYKVPKNIPAQEKAAEEEEAETTEGPSEDSPADT